MTEVIEKIKEIPVETVLRLSVEQYHSMIRSGILTEDDPVELLEGWLISKTPKNPAHSAVTRLLRQMQADYRQQQNYERQDEVPVIISNAQIACVKAQVLFPDSAS